MRKGASWVGGMVLGVALVVSCGTGVKGVVNGMADMLGVDGLISDGSNSGGFHDGPTGSSDSMVGDAKASPGNPITCTPGTGVCDGSKIYYCTYSGQDASFGYDCATSYPSTTNPATCTTTGCAAGSIACCTHTNPIFVWNITAPITTSGSRYTGQEPGATGSLSASCGVISGYYQNSVPAGPSCSSTASLTQISFSTQAAGGFTVGQTITLPNTNAALSYINEGATTVTCSGWSGSITWVAQDPSPQISINATCTQTGNTGIQVVGTFSANK